MKHLFSNRPILLQILILIASNIFISGITLLIVYNKSISSQESRLTDIVNNQKALIKTMLDHHKTESEIIDILLDIRNEDKFLGESGTIVFAHKIKGKIFFITDQPNPPVFKIKDLETKGRPMFLAISGQSGFIDALDYEGIHVFAAYGFLPKLNWGIVAKVPKSEINQPYYIAIFTAIIATFILLGLWIFIFSKVSHPLLDKLRKSEEHYRSLFENNHVSMLVIDPDTLKIVNANPAACKYYGYNFQTIIGMDITNITILSAGEMHTLFEQAQNGNQTNFYFKHRLIDGTIRDVEVSRGVIEIKGKNLVYAIIFDITDRVEAEIQVKEDEEMYRMLFESINDPVYISELTQEGKIGNFINVNEVACERLGYTKTELLTKSSLEINSEKSLQIIVPKINELFEYGHWIIEAEHVAKNGEVIPVEISTKITQFKGKTLLHSIARDITERKLAENLLHFREELYRKLFENMLNGFAYCQIIEEKDLPLDFRYIKVNSAFQTLTGLKEVEGKKVSEVIPGIQQSDKALFEIYGRVAKTGLPETFEFYLEALNMWFLISVYSPEKEFFVAVFDVITDRKEAEIQLREKNQEIEAQNEEYKQINDELNRAKLKAEESDHLKTAFLQNISHEIRTPLNAIMGFSELMTGNFNHRAKLEKYTKIIHQRSCDLLDLINEILDLAKIESGQFQLHFEEFNLNNFFTDLFVFFREYQIKLEKPNISFEIKNYSHSLKCIITDRIKLKQIFTNLIGNAFKFTENGYIKAGSMFDEEENLIFYVSDSGIGIPKEKQEFIFERFTQINHGNTRIYGGTGLGLSIVKGLVKILDGEIWIESELGKGTTFFFRVTYKTTKEICEEPDINENVESFNFEQYSILIVEDDVYTVEYLEDVLTSVRFNITHTSFGKEAYELATNHKFDIILMDIGLPDQDGYEIIKSIKKVKPNQKIIAQTAYASATDKKSALEIGCDGFLAKPLNRIDLLLMLHKHLIKIY